MTDGFPGKGIASRRPRRELSVLDVQAELWRKKEEAEEEEEEEASEQKVVFFLFFLLRKEQNIKK